MIDNFDKARQWMIFDSEDEFFFIQVLVRGKDGHKANKNNTNRTIKYYTVRSLDEFNMVEPEIKTLCKEFNARAYIHYTKRSFEQIGREMLRVVTDRLLDGNWQGMKSAFQHCCGKCFPKKNKTYLVDIDFIDAFTDEENWKVVQHCKDYINNICDDLKDPSKVLEVVKTNGGAHLICKPFNLIKFTQEFFPMDVKQNAPTLLYKS